MIILLGSAVHIASQTLASFVDFQPLTHSISLGQQLGGWLGMVLGGVVSTALYRQRVAEQRCAQEARLRREATAYLTLDLPPGMMEDRQFARLASRTIATCSSFARAALLLRDGSGALVVAGSAGIDDLSVDALNRWATASGSQIGFCSFTVQLERRAPESGHYCLEELGCARVHVVPISSSTGVLGAIVVCAGPHAAVHAGMSDEQVRQLLEPVEALAWRLAAQLTRVPAIEGSKPVEGPTACARERMQDRRRARGPQLRSDAASGHVNARIGRKIAAPESAKVGRTKGVVTEFPSASHREVPSQGAESTSAWAARMMLCPGATVGGRLRRQALS